MLKESYFIMLKKGNLIFNLFKFNIAMYGSYLTAMGTDQVLLEYLEIILRAQEFSAPSTPFKGETMILNKLYSKGTYKG